MATITGMRSNLSGGDLIPQGLEDAIKGAFGDGETGIAANLGAVLGDLDSFGDEPSSRGFISNTGTRVAYALSGDKRDDSLGIIELRGSNLPVFNSRTGEFAAAQASQRTTITQLSFSSPDRNGARVELEGSLTRVPYRIQGELESYGILNLKSLSFGDDDLRVRASGNLTITEKPDVVRKGERVSVDAVVTGKLSQLTVDLRDQDGKMINAKLQFSLQPNGVSSINDLTITKAGDRNFPAFTATNLNIFFNEDGRLSTASGRELGGSDTDNIFRGNDVLSGSKEDDGIGGYGGNDRLSGLAGRDTLTGGTGLDTLTGGAGNDVFLFDFKPKRSSDADSITDFKVGQDRIGLSLSAFGELGSEGESLADFQLTLGRSAENEDSVFVYNQANGKLFYDPDGDGPRSQVEMATLVGRPDLEASSFVLTA